MASRPAPKNEPPNKKQKTVEKGKASDDELELEEVYEKLQEVQDKIEKLSEQSAEEIIQVEKKFNDKKKPFYKERTAVLTTIPNFWKRVFNNHPVISSCLTDEDQNMFEYLEEIDVEDFEDVKAGHRISMKFKTNQWFSNQVLSKEYRFTEDGELTVVPSKVEWKSGKDITKKTGEDDRSFFSIWLQPDDEVSEELADILREEIWPNPAKYYHGLVTEEDDEAFEGAEDEDEDSEGQQ